VIFFLAVAVVVGGNGAGGRERLREEDTKSHLAGKGRDIKF
jgi:hypothetical protein